MGRLAVRECAASICDNVQHEEHEGVQLDVNMLFDGRLCREVANGERGASHSTNHKSLLWFCCKEHRQLELLRMSQETGFVKDFERYFKRNSSYTVTS
mmetsp:Transcript_9732/g.35655  ORF Transcript_9732/g.35655 Transcript_9732/m.35655 type:complete len:98 (-) Transcript_9732:302-595(-)